MRRQSKIEGYIGYFGLGDWWLSEFTDAERDYIEEKYQPLGDNRPRPLTEGRVVETSQTAGGLLSGLASWFGSPKDRHIARRLLEKAETLPSLAVLDRHFVYQGLIETYYKDRDKDPVALDRAIATCEKQIAMAREAALAFKRDGLDPLPSHLGFKQLAIIREKQGEYSEAIRLSRAALRQGWAGDWEKRVARCEKEATDVNGRGRGSV